MADETDPVDLLYRKYLQHVAPHLATLTAEELEAFGHKLQINFDVRSSTQPAEQSENASLLQ